MKARKLFKRLLKIFPTLIYIYKRSSGVYCATKYACDFFIPVYNIKWPKTQKYTVEDFNTNIKKKSKEDVFKFLGLSWKGIDPEFKCMAMNKNGEVYVYTDKPIRTKTMYKKLCLATDNSYYITTIDREFRISLNWKKCLWERTEENKK